MKLFKTILTTSIGKEYERQINLQVPKLQNKDGCHNSKTTKRETKIKHSRFFVLETIAIQSTQQSFWTQLSQLLAHIQQPVPVEKSEHQ